MTVDLKLGRLLITPAASNAVDGEEINHALLRHRGGDWGEVCAEDWETNDAALGNESRILSAYQAESGYKFWIITEADRKTTTVLLPNDY